MSKSPEARITDLETRVAGMTSIVEALSMLPVIVAAREQADTDRRRLASARAEELLKATKAAAELADLRGFIEKDPLVRVTCPHGPGSSFVCTLEFPKEKIDRGRLELAGEGSGAIGGKYLPNAWTGRASDWVAIKTAGGDELERALKAGLLAVHIYDVEETIADRRLRDAWWKSKPRASAIS